MQDTLICCPAGKIGMVTIPNSTTNIVSRAFYNCSSLTSITINATIPPTIGGGGDFTDVFYGVPTNIPVYIPCGTDYGFYSFYFTNLIEMGTIPQLCMISVDENNHNEIIWKKQEVVTAYNIYREGTQGGQYDLVATIAYDSLNKWTDTSSNAKIRSYRYKVSAIGGTCNESSDAHKTMHLTINAGQNANNWNLIWTAYEGTQYSTYNIYRTTDSTLTNWTLISTIPSGSVTSTYSDFSAPLGNVYYMVEIVLDNPCVLTKNLSSIKSNIVTNKYTVGIVEMDNYPSLRIYPNPANDKLFIECKDFMPITIKLHDILGRELLTQTANGKTEINISHLPQGMYNVNVFSEGKIVGNSKIVKQ